MKKLNRLMCIQFILNTDTHYLNNGYPSNEDQKLLNYEYKLGDDVFNWKEEVINNLSDIELLELVIRLSNNMKSKEMEENTKIINDEIAYKNTDIYFLILGTNLYPIKLRCVPYYVLENKKVINLVTKEKFSTDSNISGKELVKQAYENSELRVDGSWDTTYAMSITSLHEEYERILGNHSNKKGIEKILNKSFNKGCSSIHEIKLVTKLLTKEFEKYIKEDWKNREESVQMEIKSEYLKVNDIKKNKGRK